MNEYITLPYSDYIKAVKTLETCWNNSPEESKAEISRALLLLKNNISHNVNRQSVRQSVMSMSEMVCEVKDQIEYECFARTDRETEEVCFIIAEVLMTETHLEDGRPRKLKINGAPTNVDVVQEIFRKLTNGHVELVINNFKEITSKIYNKKAYLQTALYNSVFEFDLHYTNQVKHDFGF